MGDSYILKKFIFFSLPKLFSTHLDFPTSGGPISIKKRLDDY